jgi:hypothetical protein
MTSTTSSAVGPQRVVVRSAVKGCTTPAGSRGWLAGRPLLRRTLIAITMAAAVAATALATPATAEPGTLKVKGTLANQSFSGPSCASPVALCFKGEFRGSLKGPDEGIVNSLTPTSEPDVVFGEANLKIHDKYGDLTCHELFVYNISPTGDGPLSWLCEITSGTQRYAGASGYLYGTANAPPSTGVTTGTYHGVITLQ